MLQIFGESQAIDLEAEIESDGAAPRHGAVDAALRVRVVAAAVDRAARC